MSAASRSPEFICGRLAVSRSTWNTLRARRKVDSVKLGRRINLEEIVGDLIRQYAEGVTYFGKRLLPDLRPPDTTYHEN